MVEDRTGPLPLNTNQGLARLTGERLSFSFGENWKKSLASVEEKTARSYEAIYQRMIQ